MFSKSLYSRFLIFILLFSLLMPGSLYAQTQYPVMTLGDGTVVKLSQSQLNLLINQPGIMYTQLSVTPNLVGNQMAIPLPQELGGGYIIGTPEVIANALNNSGLVIGATSSSVLKATASAGSITMSGSLAGSVVFGGVTAGTLAVGAGIIAAIIGGVIAVTGGGGDGGGGFTVTHITTGHH